VLGAVVLVILPELLGFVGMPSAVAANVRQIVYGGLLVVMMTAARTARRMRLPQGGGPTVTNEWLEINGLSKSFDGVKALAGVNLHFV
jgi:hypothetical protein